MYYVIKACVHYAYDVYHVIMLLSNYVWCIMYMHLLCILIMYLLCMRIYTLYIGMYANIHVRKDTSIWCAVTRPPSQEGATASKDKEYP